MPDILSPGTQLGRYTIEEEVGCGGMGVVYRTIDTVLKRPAALKLMAPHLSSDPTAVARFQREATLIASFKHAHLALLYDFGEFEGQNYLVMEWIEGRSLRQVLAEEGPLLLERCLDLTRQLSGALDYAHQRGVIHRDLKPANIIIGSDDNATIIDFGLAWLEEMPTLTSYNAILGTPLYMSPEQIQGKRLDGRSDIYSLAVILYESLAGTAPFANPNTPALFRQQLFAEPPPITERNPTVSVDIELAVMQALDKEPELRYPTARAFYMALNNAHNTPAKDARAQEHAQSNGEPLVLNRGQIEETRARNPLWQTILLSIAGSIVLTLGTLFVLNQGSLFPLTLPTTQPGMPNSTSGKPKDSLSTNLALTTAALLSQTATLEQQITPALTTASNVEIAESRSPDEQGAWAMLGGSSRHLNFIYNDFAAVDYTERWRHPTSSSPIGLVGGRGLIALTEGNQLRMLEWSTGETAWEKTFKTPLHIPPTLYNDWADWQLLVATDDHALFAFDLPTGEEIWSLHPSTLNGAVVGSIVTLGTDHFLLTETGFSYGLRANTGELFFDVDLSQQDNFNHPLSATNEGLFLAGASGDLYALNVKNQEMAWVANTRGTPSTPAVIPQEWAVILLGTTEGWVQAFSLLGGKLQWEFKVEGAVVGVSTDWGSVYVVTDSGILYTASKDGQNVDDIPLLDSPIAPALVGGKCVLLSFEKDIRCINPLEPNKKPLFELTFTESLATEPIEIGGWFYVQTERAIYGFGPEN